MTDCHTTGTGNHPRSSGAMSPQVAPRTMFVNFLHTIEKQANAGSARSLDIQCAMTDAQKARYARAILKVLLSQTMKVVTPDILFKAADIALAGDVSMTEARVGLQPGTLNPIHYGHFSVSLAGMIANKLDKVLLAYGCTVPDKPDAADASLRHEMATIAVHELNLTNWVSVTPIRQQTVDMFSRDKKTLLLAGATEKIRRSNMDIAAFIWLIRANPRVAWTYLVGSDKVADYGRNHEYALIVKTLANHRANCQIIYYDREGGEIDVTVHIAPYRWMRKKWQEGFFRKSHLTTCALSASAIRKALAEGLEYVNGIPVTECLPAGVIQHILNNRGILNSYVSEMHKKSETR